VHRRRMTMMMDVRAAGAVLAGLGLSVFLAACSGGVAPGPVPSSVSPRAGRTGPPVSAPSAAVQTTARSPQAPVPVEENPPGDIPDDLAFVPYRNAAGGYAFTYPEGWARREAGTSVTFTDKLNGIDAQTAGAPGAPTVRAVRQAVVPRLKQTQPAFELRTVEAVTLPAGSGVKVVYRRNSTPDAVTGRQVRDEVESYLVGKGRRALRLDLYGPVGADNVDAYRTISQSLVLS
jgi:hypothetical protein